MAWVHGSFGTYFHKNWKRQPFRSLRNTANYQATAGIFEEGEGHSDRHSRGLSHHSTGTDAGGLDTRFGMGPGKHHRYDRAHLPESEVDTSAFGSRKVA